MLLLSTDGRAMAEALHDVTIIFSGTDAPATMKFKFILFADPLIH
jgi:hypothetical protein